MDARDSKSLRQEADVWMNQLEELNHDLDTRHDVQYGYLKAVVGQILQKTKDRASALLHELKNDRDSAKAQVAKLQSKLANGKRHGFESKEAFDTLVDEIRKSVGEIPANMMSLDPSAVHSAVESFVPTFTKYRPPPASVTAEVSLAAGLELQCRADAIITESAEFWAQIAPSAEVERELFNASLSCRLRHLAVGRNASFADRREDVKVGLNCWALLDGLYYRAVVENMKESSDRLPVEIRAVDFGLCGAVRYEDLIPFAEHDRLIPYQARRFRLYGEFRTKLPRQARWAFADAVKEKRLTIKLHSLQTASDTEHPLWEVTLTTDQTSGATVNDAVTEKALCTTALPKVHASSDIRLLNAETAAAAGIQKVVTVLNKKEVPTSGVTLEDSNHSPDVGIVSDMPILFPDAVGGGASMEPAAATEAIGAYASSNAATTSEVAGVCITASRNTSQGGIVAAPCYPALGDTSLPLTRDVPVYASVDGIARDDTTSGISDIQRVGFTVGGRGGDAIGKGEAGLRATLIGSSLLGNFAPSDAEQKPNASRNQQWAEGTNSLPPDVTADPTRLVGADDLIATAAAADVLVAPALAVQSAAGACVTHAEGCKPIAVPAPQPLVNLPYEGRVKAASGHRTDDSCAAGERFGKWRGKDRASDRRQPPQDFTSGSSRSWSARRTSRDNRAAVVVSAFGDAAAESSAVVSNVDGASSAGGTARRSHPTHGEKHPVGHIRPAEGYQAAGQHSTGSKWRNRKCTDGGRPLPSCRADRYQTSDSPEVPHVSVAVGATATATDLHVPGEVGMVPADAAPAELLAHLPIMEQTGSSGSDSCPPVEHSGGHRGKAAAAREGSMLKDGGRPRPKISGGSMAALQALLQPGSRRLSTKKTGASDSSSHDGSSTTDC